MREYILLFSFLLSTFQVAKCQKNTSITKTSDYTSLYPLGSKKNNGFEISVSAVLMFTAGVADRSGLRWGSGLALSKEFGDFGVSVGLDAYKGKQSFGIGTTFAGITYNDGKHGASYYLSKYHQGDKQISGIIGVEWDDLQIRFEDDILALPFTQFVVYDRYRTAALEVRYKHFLIGTNVYTNDANGLTDVSQNNIKGMYTSGKQVSSPVYIGYTNKNLILRYGTNNKLGGLVGQNWWHQRFFQTSDFNYGTYNKQFLQIGIDKSYTLY